MAKLQEYNGLFCESEFECAFIAFLQDEGWDKSRFRRRRNHTNI